MDKLLNTREVANLLGLHLNTIWKYILDGSLKAHKIGGNGESKRHWRIKESDLKDFINGQFGQSAESVNAESSNKDVGVSS